MADNVGNYCDAVHTRGDFPVDGTYFVETSMDNPNKSTLKTLKCPKTSSIKLHHHFKNWNKFDDTTCHGTSLCAEYNKACFRSEKRLYDYLCSLKEPMLVVNSYRHSRKVNDCNDVVQEIDVLVVHKHYGLLLFEVKDMQQVDVIGDSNGSNPKTKAKNEKMKDRCPMQMITNAEKQLMGDGKAETRSNGRWNQIQPYLTDFFQSMDRETKEAWLEHWNVTEENYIEEMLQKITNETERKKRSFICLFNWDNTGTSENDRITFKCDRIDCLCSNTGTAIVTKCDVISMRHLESFEKFNLWWNSSLEKLTRMDDIRIYEFLLNRFGLDFYLSDWFRKQVDINNAEDAISSETTKVIKEVFKKPLTQEISVLWDRLQKKALIEGRLAQITGPPGTGKTILMIEKVKLLLRQINLADSGVDERVLIICGKGDGLKSMLVNHADYLRKDKLKFGEKLLILTTNEFKKWSESENNIRCRYIFIDESQDLERESLLKIMEINLATEQDMQNQYIWILRDSSHESPGCGMELPFINHPDCTDEPDSVVFPSQNKWSEVEEKFSQFYLRYVFRSTQRQFLAFLPFIRLTSCRECSDRTDTTIHKVICTHHHPWVGVNTLGPEPMCLPMLNNGDVDDYYYDFDDDSDDDDDDDDDDDFDDYDDGSPRRRLPKDIAEKVFQAFVQGWKNFTTFDEEEDLEIQVASMINNGLLQKTVILTSQPQLLNSRIEMFLKENNLDGKVCGTKTFFETKPKHREKYLRIDTVLGFKGLESTLVIIVDPPSPIGEVYGKMEFKHGPYHNYYSVSLSRATCRSVVITTDRGRSVLQWFYSREHGEYKLQNKDIEKLEDMLNNNED